jgi:hypothetical protein
VFQLGQTPEMNVQNTGNFGFWISTVGFLCETGAALPPDVLRKACRQIYLCMQYHYQQKRRSILKLVYIHSELLHVSAKHVAIFRDIKYEV